MSDHERGAYTPPTEGGLTFDARQPVRGGGPAPMTLILSVLVLAGLVAALFFFYRSGVRHAGDAPQPVGTPVGEMRSAAPPEAQPDDPATGLQIYKSDAGPTLEQPPNFVPPPEEPAPRAAPTAKVVVTPAPAPTQAAPPTKLAQATPPAIKPALPADPPAAKAVAPPPPKVAPPPPKAAPVPPPVASTGGPAVQVGAVTSPALADKTWAEAVAAAGGAGKGKSIVKIDKDGVALYRTLVTGFGSRADAVAFCDRLKAAGKSCIVR